MPYMGVDDGITMVVLLVLAIGAAIALNVETARRARMSRAYLTPRRGQHVAYVLLSLLGAGIAGALCTWILTGALGAPTTSADRSASAVLAIMVGLPAGVVLGLAPVLFAQQWGIRSLSIVASVRERFVYVLAAALTGGLVVSAIVALIFWWVAAELAWVLAVATILVAVALAFSATARWPLGFAGASAQVVTPMAAQPFGWGAPVAGDAPQGYAPQAFLPQGYAAPPAFPPSPSWAPPTDPAYGPSPYGDSAGHLVPPQSAAPNPLTTPPPPRFPRAD